MNDRYTTHVCLECLSPLQSRNILVKSRGNSIIRICTICHTEGQIVTHERFIDQIICQVEPIKNYLEDVEIRRDEERPAVTGE